MMPATLWRPVACSGEHVRSAARGLCGNRPWRQAPATLAIVASTRSGALHGATGAAYAAQVDA
jgi:hypothetical protein